MQYGKNPATIIILSILSSNTQADYSKTHNLLFVAQLFKKAVTTGRNWSNFTQGFHFWNLKL